MKRRIALGFAAAAVAIGVLVFLADGEQLLAAMRDVDPWLFSLGFVSTVLSYLFRGYVWIRLLRLAGVGVARIRVWALFLVALFVRYLTPYGQVTTEPLVAYVVSSDGGIPFEDGLAGVVVADYLNYVPYYTVGTLGLLVFLFGGTAAPAGVVVSSGDVTLDLVSYLLGITVLIGCLLGLTAVVLYRRTLVGRAVHGLAYAGRHTIGRLSTRLGTAFEKDAVATRLDGFYQTVDLIRANPRDVLIAALAAHVGMIFLMLPVYTTAYAAGDPVSFAVVAVAVMVSKVGALFPGPGGLGGIEAVIAGALVVLTDLPLATALAITLLYRLCTYWFTIAVGGTTALLYSIRVT